MTHAFRISDTFTKKKKKGEEQEGANRIRNPARKEPKYSNTGSLAYGEQDHTSEEIAFDPDHLEVCIRISYCHPKSILISNVEGVPECDWSYCWYSRVPHCSAASRIPVDPLLADQEQEEDALIQCNSAIGTSSVPNNQCLTGPLLSREMGPAEGFQSLPVCEGVG